MTPLTDAPGACRVDGEWQWGRYRNPIRDPDLGAWGPKKLRLKEWHYTSVVTDRLFLALGLVQLGYAANAFLYLVDRRKPNVAHEYEAVSVLGRHLHFAPSSVEGRTEWSRRGAEIRMTWMDAISGPGSWEIDLDVPLGDLPLRGTFRVVAEGDALALLHDVGQSRPAYTHKQVGLEARGSVRLGDESIDLDGGLGAVDWTRSFAARETRWKWACFAGRREDGTRLGLNLSAQVYDDAQGDSRENVFWVDGIATPLGGVRFEVPRTPGVGDWHIRSKQTAASASGPQVELVFQPLGARAQHLDLKLLRSDFVQPYGVFRGHVGDVVIDDLFGVVEDHLSVW